MLIATNLAKIKSELPENVKLVAVSKTKPNEAILEAFEAGQSVFGENKVQEMVAKYESLPLDLEWHMIGHLQKNKVKYIAPFVSLIHGVDSLKLLRVIEKEAIKAERIIPVLLQVKIAREETKFGLDEKELYLLLESQELSEMTHIKICGLMGMATYTDDELQVRNEFRNLNAIFREVQQRFFADSPEFCERSMGMSHDYKIAIEEGATIVRVGASIFGERDYQNKQ